MRSWQEACYVLYRVWSSPITLKSDFARERNETILWATARGYLTTEIAPGTRDYGNQHKVTPNGLLFMQEVLAGLDREAILEIIHGRFGKEDEWE